MEINTSRFGCVQIEPDDILLFSNGLLAFEGHRHWVLLADPNNGAVAWLQSLSDPAVALALVSPRRFVSHYQVRLSRSQLTPLELAALDRAFVLTILGKHRGEVTVNLKAPVIINLDRRIGRQVVTCDEQPLQLPLPREALPLRKSA